MTTRPRRPPLDPSRLWPYDCRAEPYRRARVIDVETGDGVTHVVAADPNGGIILRIKTDAGGLPSVNEARTAFDLELVTGLFRVELLPRDDE